MMKRNLACRHLSQGRFLSRRESGNLGRSSVVTAGTRGTLLLLLLLCAFPAWGARRAEKSAAGHAEAKSAPAARPGGLPELQHLKVRQDGTRLLFVYDLTGEEGEAEVKLTLTVGDSTYDEATLHLEGDVGKVRPGKGKKLWWNVLRDFPKGLKGDVGWELVATGKAGKDPLTGMEFVLVPAGCFDMGGLGGEKPVHRVCLSDFNMAKFHVTQRQWMRVMGSNPSQFASCGEDCPVENVSWEDAQQFIGKLNAQTGRKYRLPTEAEWEYACRSSGKPQKYCGGNEIDTVGWYSRNSNGIPHPVGKKQPNGLGIYDMSGNVWQWVQDWYGSYSGDEQKDPRGPAEGSYRVVRGGSFYDSSSWVGSTTRYDLAPESRYARNVHLGFRLVLPAR